MADDAAPHRLALEEISLWPDGPPGGVNANQPPESTFRNPAASGVTTTTMLRNVSSPTLTPYPPDPAKANGVGVIVCPGGGWSILAWEHEGVDVAKWLAAKGYGAFLLKYRVNPTPADPAEFTAQATAQAEMLAVKRSAAEALNTITSLIKGPNIVGGRKMAADDGRRAVALVRERAGEWGIDPAKVGMIGFSAGAFLVTDVALEPGGAPLAFVAPIYGGVTDGKVVGPDAPPLFTAVAQDDGFFIKTSLRLFEAWVDAERPAELHAYTRGAHGFGFARQGMPVDGWPDAFAEWLKDRGLS
jgi:acetyl esterase/lipase